MNLLFEVISLIDLYRDTGFGRNLFCGERKGIFSYVSYRNSVFCGDAD